jgi:hypothetical protein
MNKKEQKRSVIMSFIKDGMNAQNIVDTLPQMYLELKKKDLLEGITLQDLQNICITEHNNAMIEKQMYDMMNMKAPPIFVKCKVVSSKIKEEIKNEDERKN